MKTNSIIKLLVIVLLILVSKTTYAQWLTDSETNNIYYNSGNVGIGTTTPANALQIIAPFGDAVENIPFSFIRQSNLFDTHVSSFRGIAKTSADFMIDGFGPRVRFEIENNTSGPYMIGDFAFIRDGADNEGAFIIHAGTNGLEEFFRINSLGNVGVGISSPVEKLDVDGNIKADMFIGDGSQLTGISVGDPNVWSEDDNDNIYYNDGNVGIGTSSPGNPLHIVAPFGDNTQNIPVTFVRQSNLNSTHVSSFRGIAKTSRDMIDGFGPRFRFEIEDDAAVTNLIGDFSFVRDGADNEGALIIHAGTNGTEEFFRINSLGNVGIGTDDPQGYKLAVAGNMIAEEVVVKLEEDWPDIVFEKDYNLKPLTEVENFIKENKHLPDIPSAEEVKEEGLSVGEMQAKLLQKIEELTLYVIDLKKENIEVRNQNSEILNELTVSNKHLAKVKKELNEIKKNYSIEEQ
ncbi:MAG: hypothetical protein PVH88_23855 [Ignavibacteria bacterium]|jgi:hypothetical protein